jgi:hypothetical protein
MMPRAALACEEGGVLCVKAVGSSGVRLRWRVVVERERDVA